MPRQGTAERRRAREGGAPVKPGVVGWVRGTKIPFFSAYMEEYLAAAELKKTGAFYDKMGHLYLATYGWNTAWTDDLPPGQTVASDVDPNEDVDALLPEVAEGRAAYFTKLKGKIGVWYKTQCGSGRTNGNDKVVPFTVLFNSHALEPPEPAKPRVVNYYSRHFYEERVSARVNARWAVVSRQADPPKFITVVNAVTREAWHEETPAFQAEVEAALEAEHKAAMDAYSIAISGEEPTTPEEYNIALNNAAYYIQPFADAMSGRFSMNVLILICGPVADRGGRIEVRSIHAGKSKGALPRIWSDFDRGGFDAAQRSLIEFSHHCFTEEECRARALDGMPMADESLAAGHVLSIPRTDSDEETPAGAQGNTGPEARGEENQGPPPTDDGDLPTPPASGNAGGDDDDDDEPATPPIIGKALARKVSLMPARERDSYMRSLSRMHLDLVERECNMARNDLMMARLKKGMSAEAVMELGSDEEEEEEGGNGADDDAAGDGGGGSGSDDEEEVVAPTKKRQRKKRGPAPGTPRQTRARTIAGGPGPESTVPTSAVPARPRPKPKPSWKGAEERTRANPDTNGTEERAGANPDTNGAEEHGGANPDVDGAVDNAHCAEPDVERPVRSPLSSASASALGNLSGASETSAGEVAVEKGGQEGESTGNTEKETMWDTEETVGWPAELRKAFAAFARGKTWGGGDWERTVRQLIALERAWGFPAKGLLSVPAEDGNRPAEVPDFMRKREWEKTVEIATALGPRTAEESFSSRWWCWWGEAQPPTRTNDAEWKAPADVEADEWKDTARRHGRNGILLYLAALLWWGEAAAADEDQSATGLTEWRKAVVDVGDVLEEAMKVVGPMRIATDLERSAAKQPRKTRSSTAAAADFAPDAAPANAKSKLRKRKNPDTPDTSAEKENEMPRKRLRSRR